MKRFMAVYTGSPDGRARWENLSEDERNKRTKAGMDAWMAWGEKNKAVIVENGGPLGKTKRVNRDGIADISNALAGYTVVEAASHDAAAKLFEGHPHFTIFPGDGVEIMEVLPIPTM
jgi:hypothetical protein